MPHSEFHHPKFLATGDLEVSGPFVLEDLSPDDLQGDVIVRFLLMQDIPEHNPTETVIVNGMASWDPHGSDDCWRTAIPASRLGRLEGSTQNGKEGVCRGIGQAILVRNVPGHDPTVPRTPPPFFDTITWCVRTEVLQAGVTRPQVGQGPET